MRSCARAVSLGHAGLHIESSTIRIPSRPNSIVDNNMNWIPSWRLSRWSRFWYNFDIILIKIDQFRCSFNLLIKIRSKIINWKIKNIVLKIENIKINQKSWYILTFSIYFDINSIACIRFRTFQLNPNSF